MFGTIQRRKLFEDVAEQIRGAIQNGSYKPGDSLPSERELMEAFDVGRPAVRDALLMLQVQGLVVIQHGQRARVADPAAQPLDRRIGEFVARVNLPSERLVADIREARLALELAIVRRAAECATPATIKKLKAAVEANRRAIHNRDAYLATDIAFHRTLAEMTGNVIFIEASSAILEWLAEFRHDLIHVDGANLLSHDEHAAIAKAVEARDPDAAVAATLRHVTRARPLYSALIEGSKNRRQARPAPEAKAAMPVKAQRRRSRP